MYEFSHSQGQTRTSADVCGKTASPPKADVPGSPREVAEGQKTTCPQRYGLCVLSSGAGKSTPVVVVDTPSKLTTHCPGDFGHGSEGHTRRSERPSTV